MALRRFHITFTVALLLLASGSVTFAAAPAGRLVEVRAMETRFDAPVFKVRNLDGSSNSSQSPHGGGTTYIRTRDLAPHVPVSTISSVTMAVVIGLINIEGSDQPGYGDAVPRHTSLRKILFRSFISPNAP